MGKIKSKFISLKWSFFIYLPICFLFAFFGSMAIGFGTNFLQDSYSKSNTDIEALLTDTHYFLISNAQFVLIPIWVMFCVAVTGVIFYRRELKKPITILLDSSRKIAKNQLDFTIEYKNNNELGQLCNAYEEMRQALDKNNRVMWRSLEERKRLNSAFSHDLRTPLTVLKGYNDFLLKYAGQLSEEKMQNVLEMMGGQINRLENYTYKMSAVQKLEDIVPDISEVQTDILHKNLETSGKYLCKDKLFQFSFCSDTDRIFVDMELIAEVYENLLSNAARYAESEIFVDISVKNTFMSISVTDNGNGFSENALKLATNPFYRGESEQNSTHFGLGLYICRILCEKLGGSLTISNSETGGNVIAEFFCESR